jgi:hypothetical protein
VSIASLKCSKYTTYHASRALMHLASRSLNNSSVTKPKAEVRSKSVRFAGGCKRNFGAGFQAESAEQTIGGRTQMLGNSMDRGGKYFVPLSLADG